jgi:hypothetical protein
MPGATKRLGLPVGFLLALVVLTGSVSNARAAGPIRLGLGVYGVYGLPIAQDDAEAGPLYGAKARVDLVGPLGAELSYTSFQEGDATVLAGGRTQTVAGGTQNAIVLNAVLFGPSAPGFGVYVAGGIGTYTLTKEGRPDESPIGYNAGLGLELRTVSGISLDLSGRVHALMPEGGGSRKFAALQAGVNYYFLR